VISWDGLVVPCCFDKDAIHKLGSLKDKSFKEVWQSDEYVKFRRDILQSRKNIDICANCSEGTTVWN
jgi:radical SAM protein with 4Fe4S-binding SPASM domain